MMVIMFTLLGGVMLAVSISMYEIFRGSRVLGWFIFLIDSSPLTQFAFHFLIGLSILMFTGEGAIAGAANLATSVIFTFYCIARNAINPAYKNIHGKPMFRKKITAYH